MRAVGPNPAGGWAAEPGSTPRGRPDTVCCVLHPAGQLPPAVYWRRRLVILAVVIVVVAIIVGAFSGGNPPPDRSASRGPSGSAPQTATSPQTSASPSTTTPPQTMASIRTTASSPYPPSAASPNARSASAGRPTSPGSSRSSSKPSPRSSTAAAASAATCRDASLALAAGTAKRSYPASGPELIIVSVRNTGRVACRRDVGAGAIEATVYAGPNRLWNNHDCARRRSVHVVTMRRGQTITVHIPWNGRTSLPGCAPANRVVGAGTYTLTARLGSATSPPVRTTITG